MAALAARGHEVQIFYLEERRDFRALIKRMVSLRKVLRQFRPDVAHGYYGAMTGFFTAFGALGLTKSVVTFRGSDVNPVPSLPLSKTLPSHILSNLAAWACTQSICVSDELRERLRLGKQKAAAVPTGVDTFFPGNREEARQKLGWASGVPVVLFNAGLSPKVKRLDVATDVVELVRQSVPDLNFVVLDGNVDPPLVPTMMQASDCLLFTSDFEGSPTVIQEAMACNLPVVSVSVGDIETRLADVVPTRIVPRNIARLAEAVVGLLQSPTRSNGDDIVQNELSNEVICAAVERIYAYSIDR